MTSTRRLYRSRSDRRIAGVCGGLAEYFNIDPTIVRLVWAVLILGAGVGLLAYVLFWIIVPSAPAISTPSSPSSPAP